MAIRSPDFLKQSVESVQSLNKSVSAAIQVMLIKIKASRVRCENLRFRIELARANEERDI